MNKTKVGSLEVPKVCLGCMGFGDPNKGMHSWTLDYPASKEIIQYAYHQGINFFDTAMAYQGGSSEEFLGKAILEVAPRDQVVIATKYIPISDAQIQQGISGGQHIRNCLEASLKRLGMDYVDLYIMHMWDYNTPILETMQTLNELIQEGKIREIGVSNCHSWQLAEANQIAKEHGWKGFASIQSHYNLIYREDEREMVSYCHSHNVAMTPYSALAAGRLSKHLDETSKRLQQDSYAMGKYDATKEADQLVIQEVEKIAENRGCSMTEVSLSWLMGKVTSPVCGATKKSHIDGMVKADSLVLTDQEKEDLEKNYVPHKPVGVMAGK